MRLIDADAIKYTARFTTYDDGRMTSDAIITKDEIDEQPTIDAVPVVRCKDCRWKEREQPGMVYCPATVGGWVDEDWFCKGGERSEE